MNNKKLLIISNNHDVAPFLSILNYNDIDIKIIRDTLNAVETVRTVKPQVVVFILPIYLEPIIKFVEEIQKDKKLKKTKIIHIGKHIDEAKLSILHKYGVKTIIHGPVPVQEMSRFILDMFKHL